MQIQGIIKAVTPVQHGTKKDGYPFQKIEFVVEEIGQQYPASLALAILGDRVNQYSQMLVANNLVTAHFGTTARVYNGKYYNSVNCWKVEPLQAQQPQQQFGAQPVEQLPF